MGYSTEFEGEFVCSPKLNTDQVDYLNKLAQTRRMARDNSKLKLSDLNKRLGLGLGEQGEYYVHGGGFGGQDREDSILDYNTPPRTQPGLWCQWAPTEDGEAIGWDGGEKFYNYINWIKYIIQNFLKPWGVVLNGEVTWQGEDYDDFGKIVIDNNVVKIFIGERSYKEA